MESESIRSPSKWKNPKFRFSQSLKEADDGAGELRTVQMSVDGLSIYSD